MKRRNTFLLLISASFLLGGCAASGGTSSTSFDSEINDPGCVNLTITKPIQNVSPKSCPSKGNVKALVVPVHFSDDENRWNDTSVLSNAFEGTADWINIRDFYKKSSYGLLNFDFEMTDVYTPDKPSSYYENKANFNGDSYNTASSRTLYEEVLTHFDSLYNYSDYDSDKDGIIDCIYLIYDHPVDYTYANMFWWAYTAAATSETTYDGVAMGKYIWCGYDFLKKDDEDVNTHTLIHETGHLFGLDDYYDYSLTQGTSKGGLAGADLMDNDDGAPSGDHNSYSKSLLGWTSPKVITTKEEITLSLKPLQKEGDCLILANDFDESKELYQEFFLLEYYTPTELQSYDAPFGVNGVRMLHINGTLTSKGTFKYDNSYTQQKLISQITTSNGDTYLTSTSKRSDATLFTEGEKLSYAEYADETKLNYVFEVESCSDDEAKIKITYSA